MEAIIEGPNSSRLPPAAAVDADEAADENEEEAPPPPPSSFATRFALEMASSTALYHSSRSLAVAKLTTKDFCGDLKVKEGAVVDVTGATLRRGGRERERE